MITLVSGFDYIIILYDAKFEFDDLPCKWNICGTFPFSSYVNLIGCSLSFIVSWLN